MGQAQTDPAQQETEDLSPNRDAKSVFDHTIKRATSRVGLLAAYLVAVTAAVLAFKEFREPLKDTPLWFRVTLIFLLPSAVFIFQIIPELLERHRKKQLSQITGDLRPGYFCLRPRESGSTFTRPDGEHHDILQWLQKRRGVLYLTGLSGTGKSSLLNAWVLPHLEGQGVVIIRVRGYQDPLTALQRALQQPGVIWQKPSGDRFETRVLIERACRHIRPRHLLIVFDQFEEFIILQNRDNQRQFEGLLSSLSQNAIDELTMLLVFRSDYIGLVEELELPRLLQDVNWRDVPPFTERAAREFIQHSGLQLDEQLLADVLHEAAETERTKGLVRPITINLCGLVLGRFAGGFPSGFRSGTLISSFIRESVMLPEIRDVGAKIISNLISDYLTKQARTITELAQKTALKPAVILGCLRRLGQSDRSIVRPLDPDQDRWEISHDFLVPLLDSVVARWKVSFWKRIRSWVPWLTAASALVIALYGANLKPNIASNSASEQKNLALMIETDRLYDKALSERESGNEIDALKTADEMLAVGEQLRTHILNQGLRERFSSATRRQYEFYIELLMQLYRDRSDDVYARQALEASERARSRTAIEILNENAADIRKDADPGLLQRYESLRNQMETKLIEETKLRVSNDADQEQFAALRSEIDQLFQDLQKIQQAVRENHPRYEALVQPRFLKSTEIQALLDNDTIVLEYALGSNASFMWLVSRSEIKTYQLPKRSIIESVARQVYKAAQPRYSRGDATSSELVRGSSALLNAGFTMLEDGDVEYWKAASTLSKMILVNGIRNYPVKRLVIVPDGELKNVSFASLPDFLGMSSRSSLKDGVRDMEGIQPLIVRYEVVSAPSAAVLAALRQQSSKREIAPNAAIVFADPVFSSRDARVQRDAQGRHDEAFGGDVLRLPSSKIEANEISEALYSEGVTRAVGFEATRELATGSEMRKYRIVHFTTHSIQNQDHPELSALVLSLVDQRGKSRDGFLRLLDIYELKLSAELVVLNGCRTSELSKAFMGAGGTRVVGTLWNIEDEFGSEFMRQFYLNLSRGIQPPSAMRMAQLAMLHSRKWHSPHYWASYILEGDWR